MRKQDRAALDAIAARAVDTARQEVPLGPGAAGAAGAVDLAALRMPPEDVVAEALRYAELEAGLRCRGCTRRIGVGFKFTRISATPQGIRIDRQLACSREDCGHAQELRAGAQTVEMIEYAWVDEGGVDASALTIDEPAEQSDEPATAAS